MQKGLINVNEYYTSNFWDDVLGKELAANAGKLPNINARISALKSLERDFWAVKDSIRSETGAGAGIGRTADLDALVALHSKLLTALNFSPSWHKRSSLESGDIFTTFFTSAGDTQSEVLGLLVATPEFGDFESVAVFGATLDDGETKDERSISDILDDEFINSQTPPRWAMVCAPNAVYLIERTKWNAGRYIQVDLEEVLIQRRDEVYAELLGLLGREHLAPESGRSLHDDLDESSHRHAFAVTTALREAVRQSIEDLINEIVFARRQAHKKFMPEGEADSFARELTHDALFYVYRLIFLMYVESHDDYSGDDEVLPLKSEIYRNGYSVEKLIEVSQQDLLAGSADYEGFFLQTSLDKIFELIWDGYGNSLIKDAFILGDAQRNSRTGFFVKGLKADLFDPAKVPHLKDTRIRNCVLQQILKRLSWTKGEGRRAQVGRISYSALGINQLGAVYEGLLSYTGYFAKEPLVALKPASIKQEDIDRGKELDQVYLCPKPLAESYRQAKSSAYKLTKDNFVLEPDGSREIEYPRGSFIYRMAGRDRQKLASYYTPESLTKLTVKYALKVLFETKGTPEELLRLKILEPAMGSGAFLNEAVTQIASRVLDLEVQRDPKAMPRPEDKQRRLNAIKYHLVSHCVYGVDLNPTAIELARFSLWLNCLGAGKDPPDLKDKLKIGNSLISARFDKTVGGVYPWLLLDKGIGDYGNKLRDYDPEGFAKLKDYRRELLVSALQPTDPRVATVQSLAEDLFKEAQGNAMDALATRAKLKLAADFWCSLFFAAAADLDALPNSHESLLKEIQLILETGKAPPALEGFIERNIVAERFFHWDLEFSAEIGAGGFDLILANPPWVDVSWRDALWVSDFNPIPAVMELNAANTNVFIEQDCSAADRDYLGTEYIRLAGYANLLETDYYSDLRGVRKNTYKAFDILMMRLQSPSGAIGVIQEDGVLDDEGAAALRLMMYRRFRYHFQFQNELLLFADIHDAKRYSVNILGASRSTVNFKHIGNLFTPKTADDCFEHTAAHDPVPLVKTIPTDENEKPRWDTRGHKNRVVTVDDEALRSFGAFLNSTSTAPPFLNLHSTELLGFVKKIGACTTTLGSLAGDGNYVGADMLNEVNAQNNGLIKRAPGRARSIDRLVLSGPNIGAGNPLLKDCRIPYSSNQSYDHIDLTTIPEDFIPRTVFAFVGDIREVDGQFPMLHGRPYRSYYRIATRNMVNPANERCCFSAILPPGTMHVHTIASVTFVDPYLVLLCTGNTASLVADGILRMRAAGHFYYTDFPAFPCGSARNFDASIQRRVLALNCLTLPYTDLWASCKDLHHKDDGLLSGTKLAPLNKPWQKASALRQPADREQAMVEIDALVALAFGMTADELVQIYEVLFPVLHKYDRESAFDRQGLMRTAHKFFSERGW